MNKRCQELWEGIVNLAEGQDDSDASEHVASCSSCAAKLDSLRKTMRLGDLRFYDAPASLIESVKGLMPAPRRAPLIRSTLAWSGARAVAEDFQLVVGSGEDQVRLMFVRSGDGWEVFGRLPGTDYSVSREGDQVEADADGGFSFEARDLAHTDFTLSSSQGELYVPAAEELLSRGSDDRD